MLLVTAIFAQVPQGINYQSVVRDNNGETLPNQNVAFRFSVVSGSPTGTIVYSELHSTSTNQLGLVNLVIGEGTPITGLFSNISWGSASHYLSVELDASGGTSFQPMGTQQLMSVPYALSAGNSSTSMAQLTDVIVTGVADGQVLKWNATQSKWLPANDVGGGMGDNWGTQTVQTNNTLSGDGTSSSPLAVNGVLTDNQTLSVSGTTLSISGGNSVTLPSGGVGGGVFQQIIPVNNSDNSDAFRYATSNFTGDTLYVAFSINNRAEITELVKDQVTGMYFTTCEETQSNFNGYGLAFTGGYLYMAGYVSSTFRIFRYPAGLCNSSGGQ